MDYPYFNDDKLHIILCGTGSPIPDPDHLPACIAIITKRQIMLVDTGDGATRTLESLNLPIRFISKVFITHFHSDHIAGLGQVINRSWIFGRTQPIDIYGPEGIKQVVDGFEQAYSLDADYRTKHHGKHLKLHDRSVTVNAFEFNNPGDLAPLLEDDDLTVSSFLVDHRPVEPAVGYRFEHKGKVLVVSGDTTLNSNIERYSKNADILIHSVMNKEMVRGLAKGLQETDDRFFQRQGKMLEHILGYHIDTTELGELAQKSGAKRLVLTHLVPSPSNSAIREAFESGIAQSYKGELIVGEDRMHLEL